MVETRMPESVRRRPAAGAGVVGAAVALVGATRAWPAITGVDDGFGVVTSVLAVVALAAFLGLRYDRIGHRLAAAVAGAASAALVGYAFYGGYQRPVSEAALSSGPNVAAAGGAIGLVAAYLAYRDVPDDQLLTMGKATVIYTVVGIGGLLSIYVVTLLMLIVLQIVGVESTRLLANALSTLALGIGMGTTAFVALRTIGVGLDYVDVTVPSLRDLGYAVGGVIALFAVLIAVTLAFSVLGVQSGEHAIVDQAQGNPDILLVMIPASYVFVGPGEELLFRNVIQKRLYDHFSDVGAVVLASVIFGAVHFPAYGWNPSNVLAVFCLSLVLGTVYLRTKNLLVPAFVHGTFNAIQFWLLYVQLTGGA
ncbi:CPBP family intramembrane metalloprotease domain-containing protein [Halobacteriales archaeon QS_1_68_20]|nr:MAG: CPBP family intramembrane metalloprotease domain-containing protein [Halobacteriales archaeon QS_1_68_20]